MDQKKMTPLHYIASYGFSTKWYEDWTEDDRSSNFQFQFLYSFERGFIHQP